MVVSMLGVGSILGLVADKERSKLLINNQRAACIFSFHYPHEIDLGCIRTERDLFDEAWKLAATGWMTPERLSHFLDTVAEYKGFRKWTAIIRRKRKSFDSPLAAPVPADRASR